MKFCTHCGKQLLDEAVICPNCGCMQGAAFGGGMTSRNADADERLLQQLSTKIKTNGIIWLCIGILQILGGTIVGYYFNASALFVTVVGVLNIVSSIKDLKYSDEILKNPVGIVNKFEPITGPIITLIYNLIFGGVIGVVGSLYYLFGIRSFVLNNRAVFDAMNKKHSQGAVI